MLSSNRRSCFFKPIAIALAWILALPILPHLGGKGDPFSASAQIYIGPAPSPYPNPIIQKDGPNLIFNVQSTFEIEAVKSWLARHGLQPDTDIKYVYEYGGAELRNELRAYMLNLIAAYANAGQPASMDGAGYYWLQYYTDQEEQLYWAAAANEYENWNNNKCNYVLDANVAAQQNISYLGDSWCATGLAGAFSFMPVPSEDYFEAVAWEKTYGVLLGGASANSQSTPLFTVQQNVGQLAAEYVVPAVTAAVTAAAVAANNQTIFSYLPEEVEEAVDPIAQYRVPYVPAKLTGYGGQSAVADAAEDTAEIASDAADAVGATAGFVFAVAVAALEIAVQAGIEAVQDQQNLDNIQQLPSKATSAAQNPQPLQTLLGDQTGFTKASVVFTSLTLPDKPSQLDAANFRDEGQSKFWDAENALSTYQVSYKDWSGNAETVQLRGGWLINQAPSASAYQLVGKIYYQDFDGSQRYASRISPSKFVVARNQPISTDVDCSALDANGLSIQPKYPNTCFSYITDRLQTFAPNGQQQTLKVLQPIPTLTRNYADFPVDGTARSYALSLSPSSIGVPCSVSITNLPSGLQYDAQTNILSGVLASGTQIGVISTPLTIACGNQNGESAQYPFYINAGGSNVRFSSPSSFTGIAGYSTFEVTAVGSPTANLTGTFGDPHLSLKDNGNGTATISYNSLPCDTNQTCTITGETGTITAQNQFSEASQNVTFALQSASFQFTSPTVGTTLNFEAGTVTTYPVASTTNTGTKYSLSVASGTAPSWLAFIDNGDGTGTLTGDPPFGTEGTGAQVKLVAASGQIGSASETVLAASQVNPYRLMNVESGSSLAFVAGAGQPAYLASNVPISQSPFEPAGNLPPGLTFQLLPLACNPSTAGCEWSALIAGTPPVGSGGHYKVPFSSGGVTQNLDIVVYDKPQLASADPVILYAGINKGGFQSVINVTGYPLAPIGPFPDGIGHSAGVSYTASGLPSNVSLISSAVNGTATLQSQANTSNYGHYTITLTASIHAAPAPNLTDPSQLSNTLSVDLYVAPPGDVNLDYRTDCSDVAAVKAAFRSLKGSPGWSRALDINNDGVIDIKDLAFVTQNLPSGTVCH